MRLKSRASLRHNNRCYPSLVMFGFVWCCRSVVLSAFLQQQRRCSVLCMTPYTEKLNTEYT